MVKKMESCEFFLGIDSGPMHLAAVLELKSIVIINDSSSGLHLPCLKECRVPNSEWLYPQNTHLNRAGENQLVARFNFENLAAAFLGETYPYWSEEYLDIKIKE
jgi:ADP-heptose:LPS heptosyltransferase